MSCLLISIINSINQRKMTCLKKRSFTAIPVEHWIPNRNKLTQLKLLLIKNNETSINIMTYNKSWPNTIKYCMDLLLLTLTQKSTLISCLTWNQYSINCNQGLVSVNTEQTFKIEHHHVVGIEILEEYSASEWTPPCFVVAKRMPSPSSNV